MKSLLLLLLSLQTVDIPSGVIFCMPSEQPVVQPLIQLALIGPPIPTLRPGSSCSEKSSPASARSDMD